MEYKNPEEMNMEGLTINRLEQSVYYGGAEILLTNREFQILYFLMLTQGKVFSKKQIYEQISGDKEKENYHRIDVMISRMRRKLEAVTGRRDFVVTVRERGYKFKK